MLVRASVSVFVCMCGTLSLFLHSERTLFSAIDWYCLYTKKRRTRTQRESISFDIHIFFSPLHTNHCYIGKNELRKMFVGALLLSPFIQEAPMRCGILIVFLVCKRADCCTTCNGRTNQRMNERTNACKRRVEHRTFQNWICIKKLLQRQAHTACLQPCTVASKFDLLWSQRVQFISSFQKVYTWCASALFSISLTLTTQTKIAFKVTTVFIVQNKRHHKHLIMQNVD